MEPFVYIELAVPAAIRNIVMLVQFNCHFEQIADANSWLDFRSTFNYAN